MPTFSLSWSVRPVSPGFSSSRWWWGVTAACPELPDGLEAVRSGIAATAGEADILMRAHRADLREELERVGFEVMTEGAVWLGRACRGFPNAEYDFP